MRFPFSRPDVDPVLIASDLSTWGRVALSACIPALEGKGIQACPLPTALLSAHGGYPGGVFEAQTPYLGKALAHLSALEIRFSALLTGFVAEEAQFDLLEPLALDIRGRGGFILADPVMGDNGKLYGFFNDRFVERMARFVSRADLITPNLTEGALLLGKHGAAAPADEGELRAWTRRLSDLGPRLVALTSVPIAGREDRTGVALYDRERDRFRLLSHARLGAGFPGTGDFFAAELLGRILRGAPFFSAAERTVARLRSSIAYSRAQGSDPRSGLRRL